jgi:hypothetical protein
MSTETPDPKPAAPTTTPPAPAANPPDAQKPNETGGPPGLEPTRYGDWEKNGRCIDF